MYAREGAQVSARYRHRIPAGAGERNAVGEDARNQRTNPDAQCETVACSHDSGGGRPVIATVRHAHKTSVIVDRVAVDDNRGLVIRLDMRARSGKRELLGARYYHAYVGMRRE